MHRYFDFFKSMSAFINVKHFGLLHAYVKDGLHVTVALAANAPLLFRDTSACVQTDENRFTLKILAHFSNSRSLTAHSLLLFLSSFTRG
jgi:hypothetical protein